MFENMGPNKALMSHLTKMSKINKNQTESEDSNDPDLDLELDSDGQIKSFIFEPQCGSLSEEEDEEEQELVIESDNIKGDRVCCIQLLQCWKSKEVVLRQLSSVSMFATDSLINDEWH